MKSLYRVLFIGFIVVIASSCRKNLDNLSPYSAERKIEGTWTMTSVYNKVRGDGKWGKNDVSGSYQNWEFEFRADYTLRVYIPAENKELIGTWEVYEDWETDSDGDSDLNTFLYMYMYDPVEPEKFRTMTWEDMRVSSNSFKAVEETFVQGKRVFYHYELRR